MKPTFALRSVRLRVASLERAQSFYSGLLELTARSVGPGRVAFSAGAGQPELITLVESPGAQPKPPTVPGLFHTALLLPGRAALARIVRRLSEARYPLDGLADHGVSEALYLTDPDDNGIELYVDRPAANWPRRGDRVAMFTAPVNLDELLAAAPDGLARGLPPETRLGHVHLRVSDLAQAGRFYTTQLGLAVRQDDFPGALFLAADGYHHHLGLNIWGGPARPTDPRYAGLEAIQVSLAGLTAPQTWRDPDGLVIEASPLSAD